MAQSELSGNVASAYSAIDDPDVQRGFCVDLSHIPGALPHRVDTPDVVPVSREAFLSIEGMTCAACAQIIERRLTQLGGMGQARVNAASGFASITFDPGRLRLSDAFAAIAALGYQPFPADDHRRRDQARRQRRLLLWQFLVALLAMMQVMMYAWPSYVSAPGSLPPDIVRLFAWASWVMSIPVVLFSARPFFAGAWTGLKSGRLDMDVPVAIGIGVTFAASSWGMYAGTETYFDSLTMFVAFLLGGRLWERSLRERSASDLERLTRRLPPSVERLAGTRSETVAVPRLRVGDLIRMPAGSTLPADGLVMSMQAWVDESILTGESEPILRRCGETVLAGSLCVSGPVILCITQLGADSRYGQIAALMERASAERPAIARIADRYSQWFVGLVLTLSLLSALGWHWAGRADALWIALSVLIVTCPCALSLAVPVSVLAGVSRLSREGVLVAHPSALEVLASIDTVVFDKTGTLTDLALSLDDVEILRRGWSREQILGVAKALEAGSLHPIARAIHRVVPDQPEVIADQLLETCGEGVSGRVRGRQYRLGRLGLSENPNDTTVAVLSDPDGPIANLRFKSSVRPEALAATKALREEGLTLHVLSGDAQAVVERTAHALNIDHWQAQARPEHKHAQIKLLQSQGHRLLFVGDGINDAPALGTADVSVAMGQGAPIAQSGADLILLRDNLEDLVLARRVARRTLGIIRQNLAWALTYNLVCVPMAVAGWMPPWLAGLGMAVSSLLVVANATRLNR